jgi:hypothetical protein
MEKTERFDHEAGGAGRSPASERGKRLLGVSEVMERYGLRDRRTTRGVMDTAGAFVVARRLYVREADLVAYEDALRAARRSRPGCADPPRGRQGLRRPTPTPVRPEPLPPGWWREDSP